MVMLVHIWVHQMIDLSNMIQQDQQDVAGYCGGIVTIGEMGLQSFNFLFDSALILLARPMILNIFHAGIPCFI